jgi:flagellar biosynthesis/type III secretory pathway protein FliH
VDIYVYDLNLESIPDGITSKAVKDEFEAMANVIRAMEERGDYLHTRELADGTAPKDGRVEFLWRKHELAQRPQAGKKNAVTRISESYLRGFHNKFIKVRATYLEERQAEGEKAVRDLIQELASQIVNAESTTGSASSKELVRTAIETFSKFHHCPKAEKLLPQRSLDLPRKATM